jgi:hypothetical protein
MSQQNKTPWTPANNTAKTKGAALSSAKQSLATGKQMKQDGLAQQARAQKNAPNLPGWANASNNQNAANKISTAKTMTTQAKTNIKANTPKGPVIGANKTPKK